MADNFLERHQQDYEKRKAEWQRKSKYRAILKKVAERKGPDSKKTGNE